MGPGKSKRKEKKVLRDHEEISHLWQEMEKFLETVTDEQKPLQITLLKDIFKAAMKMAQESPGTLNLKIAATAIKELRYSFKMFHPHRFTSKITMFGSARVPPSSPLYRLARQFAKDATRKNYMVMTGGGPGIMATGNEGAKEKGGFGLNIILPNEQDPNPFVDTENMLIYYKYFFTRKLFLVKEANAFAFFPGGFGTFDEAFEVLTLLQSGKANPIPVVMLEPEGFGYWKKLSAFLEGTLQKNGFISPNDKHLFHVFHKPSDALDHIVCFYKSYHSMRFVREKLVFRLKKALSDSAVKKINQKFSDIVSEGKFVLGSPLPEEENEPKLAELPRLIFHFNRKDYARLRCLIDFINENTV